MLDLQHSFPGQEEREAIFVFVRPYFLAFVPASLVFTLIFILALVIQVGVRFGYIGSGLGSLGVNAVVLGLGVFELFVLIVYLIALLDFYYDILIVTDRRLVDIEQKQLFHRDISEMHLEEIQDVNSQVSGFFATIFGFGQVLVQTAGSQANFIFKNLRHPREVASIISDLSRQAKRQIPALERRPETPVMGVINDTRLANFEELVTAGAITTDDPRRMPGSSSSPPGPPPEY